MDELSGSRASVTISRKSVDDARLEKGLTLQALADESKLGLATIKRACGRKGEYRCDHRTAEALTRSLDVSIDQIRNVKPYDLIILDGVEKRISDLISVDDPDYYKVILLQLRFAGTGEPLSIDTKRARRIAD